MCEPESIFEARRRAPLHHSARAENALYCAYVLSKIPKRQAKSAKAKRLYRGTPTIALGEAFMREGALALELILKAVIAQRIENDGHATG